MGREIFVRCSLYGHLLEGFFFLEAFIERIYVALYLLSFWAGYRG